MYPPNEPEKQAPEKATEKESQAKPAREQDSERPDDHQVFRDWASI